ncbi:MAG TPA: preprotein translocase subunit YajC [Phycisphaerae bacterium]|nr:preprotein translocase subunit YajC [Phycisphaerae bacterium]
MQTYAIIAEEAAPQPEDQKPQEPCSWQMMVPMLLVFVVLYLVMIRPQQKKQKEAQRKKKEMLGDLKRNDHIMTIGGIHGVVASVGEQEVTIKIDEKADVKMRVSRDAVSRVVGKDEEGAGEEGGTTLGDGSDAGR